MVVGAPTIAWLGALRRLYHTSVFWQRLFCLAIILASIFYLILGFYLIFDETIEIGIIIIIRVEVRYGDAVMPCSDTMPFTIPYCTVQLIFAL